MLYIEYTLNSLHATLLRLKTEYILYCLCPSCHSGAYSPHVYFYYLQYINCNHGLCVFNTAHQHSELGPNTKFKNCIRETLNLLTNADRSIDTKMDQSLLFFLLLFSFTFVFIIIFFHFSFF